MSLFLYLFILLRVKITFYAEQIFLTQAFKCGVSLLSLGDVSVTCRTYKQNKVSLSPQLFFFYIYIYIIQIYKDSQFNNTKIKNSKIKVQNKTHTLRKSYLFLNKVCTCRGHININNNDNNNNNNPKTRKG